MDLGLKDKVAIVGGASKGLGRACAEVLSEEGATVVMCSRTLADLETSAEEIRKSTGGKIMVYAGDLEKLEIIQDLINQTVNEYGHLDIMVNNSGGPPLARSFNATEEWDQASATSTLTVS